MALPARDAHLVQIVDAAIADGAAIGVTVCVAAGDSGSSDGVSDGQQHVDRLRDGLAALDSTDPERASALRQRARQSVARLTPDFPGDPRTGLLDEDRAADFDSFANDEPCPVLDPATGLCDLYAARPITCRVFGPPLRTEDGLGVCELCFHGATHEEIAACEVHLDSDSLESSLTAEAEQTAGRSGNTIVAWALAR